MKNKVVVVIGIMLVMAGAKANVLQIREAQAELEVITNKRAEAKANLKLAQKAYKELDNAFDEQKASVRHAKKAHDSQVKAEMASIESSKYSKRKNPYLQDTGHSSGNIRLVEVE